MRRDIPFNFDMGWEDWDAFYHNPEMPKVLKPREDPCSWSEEQKARVNAQRDEWVRQYNEWCDADDQS